MYFRVVWSRALNLTTKARHLWEDVATVSPAAGPLEGSQGLFAFT